jgi:site-specific DNA-methyltransferase (adenine-specific)
MDDKSIDLTVTSPPYDNMRNYNGYMFDFENIAKELLRVTKNGGVVVWVVNDQVVNRSESGTSFRQALYFKEIGFNLHDTMIYKSEGLTMNHNRYEQEFEYMFILSNGKPKTFNPIRIMCKSHLLDGDRSGQKTGAHDEKNKKLRSAAPRTTVKKDKIKGNIWKYSTGYNKSTDYKDAFKHPAIFPELLAIDHIMSWSNKGDTIYDPFMGSGTTAVAAIKHERKYVGSEISEEYCEIANKRITIELSQARLPL